MATRLQITLDRAERSALVTLAEKELRDPGAQARFLLRQELKRQGYLVADEEEKTDNTET